MRIPPLLTDFIHDRVCKPNCEKMLTLPIRPCKEKQYRIEKRHAEDGYMPFFVFGKNRIRISEHFESSEKTLPELVEETIQNVAGKR